MWKVLRASYNSTPLSYSYHYWHVIDLIFIRFFLHIPSQKLTCKWSTNKRCQIQQHWRYTLGENHYSNHKLIFHNLLTKCWLLNSRRVSVLGLCAALLHKWNLSLPTNTASLLPLPLLRPFTISESTPLPLPLKLNTFSGFRERTCVQPSLRVAFNRRLFRAMAFSELSGFSELWLSVQTSNLLFFFTNLNRVLNSGSSPTRL